MFLFPEVSSGEVDFSWFTLLYCRVCIGIDSGLTDIVGCCGDVVFCYSGCIFVFPLGIDED